MIRICLYLKTCFFYFDYGFSRRSSERVLTQLPRFSPVQSQRRPPLQMLLHVARSVGGDRDGGRDARTSAGRLLLLLMLRRTGTAATVKQGRQFAQGTYHGSGSRARL